MACGEFNSALRLRDLANISSSRKTWNPPPPLGPRVFGFAPWRIDQMKIASELAQDRRARDVSTGDVVNSIGDAGSTRSG